MKKTLIIASKEWRSFTASPIAFVVAVAAVVIFNVFFYLLIDQNQEASLRDVLSVMEFMYIFFVPLLTMRLMAEEKSQGTMEFLLTTPTRVQEIVAGKFLGAWAFVIILSTVIWIYYGIMMFFSKPDFSEILCGWTGLVLEAGFFTAVGLMVSSWTRHQLIAAIGSMFILFVLFLLPAAESYATGLALAVIKSLGTTYHLEHFSAGFFGISDIVYYGTGILLCLTVARCAAEHRLWH